MSLPLSPSVVLLLPPPGFALPLASDIGRITRHRSTTLGRHQVDEGLVPFCADETSTSSLVVMMG